MTAVLAGLAGTPGLRAPALCRWGDGMKKPTVAVGFRAGADGWSTTGVLSRANESSVIGWSGLCRLR